MLDAVLVGHLRRQKKSEVEFDSELVVILDKYVFHDRPTRKRHAATQDRDRRQLEILGRFDSLTPAQRDVYWLMINGSKNIEISSQLGISINTVKTHRAAVFRKMEVSSVLELVTKTDVLRKHRTDE
jgi:DNA-binding CsgD family transcriptional regulator